MMKGKLKILTSLILCISILMIPMQVMAVPEEKNDKPLYISEVKVGMGSTSEEAAKELLAEDFTIIKGDDGKYADLNEKAGTNSGMKEGPTDKIVYIGYKTTDDPKQAITDLAVMNMNGGYSVQDYETLMANHLEGEIKPFVERFISTLKEYRENYKKPEKSLNHIRADYYRQLLNKLTDDDTGGQPLGDLLLNETKYEMGDEKYNALSDAEKKNHADILSILMQGNGHAVMLVETLIAKASDTADNTWMDRITDFDTLKENVKKDNPNLTNETDINAELDKKYYDTAMILVRKQAELMESMGDEEETAEIENKLSNKEDKTEEVKEKIAGLGEDISDEEATEIACDVLEAETDMLSGGEALENIIMTEYLDVIEYNNESLLDFFLGDEGYSEENIRSWYPVAASLSEGQLAALDFLSLRDLILGAITNEDGYKDPGVAELSTASVYQDVDRAIYEPGGVALTNVALRAKMSAGEDFDNTSFSLSNLGVILWVCTGVGATAAGATLIAAKVIGKMKPPAELVNRVNELTDKILNAKGVMEITYTDSFYLSHPYYIDTLQRSAMNNIIRNTNELRPLQEQLNAAEAQIAAKSTVCKYLSAGFMVVTALLAGYAVYTTVTEMLDYYKVTFTPIPKYIVEEADITQEINGRNIVINNRTAYYKVVSCNRKEGKSNIEKNNYKILGSSNDLNGDVGKQWLSLYSVKYQFGNPILADSMKVVKGTDVLPKGYETGIHRFGEKPAFNLTSKYYCYNDDVKGTYVYFKNAQDTVAAMTMKTEETKTAKTEKTTDEKTTENDTSGSMFSVGSLTLGAGIGLFLGGGIVVLILLPRLKKKNRQLMKILKILTKKILTRKILIWSDHDEKDF